MPLTEEDIREFIDVYEAEYGVRLRLEDAWEIAERVVSLHELLSHPLPDVENLGEERLDK